MADVIRIVTEQAPSAKPISSSLVLTTSWQTIINVPEYDIPVVGFGQSRRIAPGVAEVSGPMLISNTNSSTARVGIRVIRNFRPLIVSQTQDDYSQFSGGQDHVPGDTIELNSGAQITVDQVDANGEVTEFTVSAPGLSVARQSFLFQTDSSGPGVGFSLNVSENNQSQTEGVFFLVNNFPVEASDTQVIPLNGQFFQTGDRLQVISDTEGVLHATISYTEGQAEEDDLPFFNNG